MKKLCHRGLALLLVCLLLPAALCPAAAATGDTVILEVTGTYDQTSARAMLAQVNAFRHGENGEVPWYWNPDNATKTLLPDLQDLTYDYDLERIAMQRAMEAAVSWGHERPNGDAPLTLGMVDGVYAYHGENLAAGQTSNDAAMDSWREDHVYYADQGHRRNMLDPDFTAIGIGHVVVNGVHYWAQAFRVGVTNTRESPALNADAAVEVETLVSNLAQLEEVRPASEDATLRLRPGETAPLPALTCTATLASGVQFHEKFPVTLKGQVPGKVTWTSDRSDVLTIAGNTLTAQAAGTAVLTAQLAGGESLTWTVEVENLADYAAYDAAMAAAKAALGQPNLYTPESLAALQAAVEQNTLPADLDPSRQGELDAAADALEGALKDLVPDYLLGDLNLDRQLSVADVVLLRRAILNSDGGETYPMGDMNNDGGLTVADVVLLRRAVLNNG